jgi:hypothetical protein
MSVDHDRFTGFAESAVIGIFSGHNNADAHEDAGAAAGVVQLTLSHDDSMLRQSRTIVNIRVRGMFPRNNGYVSGYADICGAGFSLRG